MRVSPLLLLSVISSCRGGLWPDDWAPSDGLPACPDCARVMCLEQLSPGDCPLGHQLVENILYGCCPACVKYQEYGDKCPGLTWTADSDGGNVVDVAIMYGEDSSGSLIPSPEWPNSLIQASVELPCVTAELHHIYSNKTYSLQERALSVQWVASASDEDRHVPAIHVPAIHVPHCRPDLTCLQMSYIDCDIDCDADDKHCCNKYSPGQGADGLTNPTKDPFPICNAVPVKTEEFLPFPGTIAGYESNTDCKEQPCTCAAMDYSLWESRQWGEDCSFQMWKPQCDTTGVFSAVQIKSNSVQDHAPYSWCSAPSGERLPGREKDRGVGVAGETDMTCACAQKRWELEQGKKWDDTEPTMEVEAREDVTLHCTELGNYEKLQCDKGLCWCVEEKTGKVRSKVVPESVLSVLPCSATINMTLAQFGSQYLRKCENRAVGIARTRQILRAHGLAWTPTKEYECDNDGGFAPVQCDQQFCSCWESSGQVIDPFRVETSERRDMSCACARDKAASIVGSNWRTCAGNGDYATLQRENGMEFCADKEDGWQVSGKVKQDSTLPCCLDTDYLKETSDPGQYYPTSGYVLWDSNRNPSFKCRAFEWADSGETSPACKECHEDVRKCQI